jgi:hypothetical protein
MYGLFFRYIFHWKWGRTCMGGKTAPLPCGTCPQENKKKQILAAMPGFGARIKRIELSSRVKIPLP